MVAGKEGVTIFGEERRRGGRGGWSFYIKNQLRSVIFNDRKSL